MSLFSGQAFGGLIDHRFLSSANVHTNHLNSVSAYAHIIGYQLHVDSTLCNTVFPLHNSFLHRCMGVLT